MKNHFNAPNYKTIQVTIGAKKYDVNAMLSKHDFEIFQKDCHNTKYNFAEFIHNKIVSDEFVPTIDEIVATSDDNFKPFIDALIMKYSTLQKPFDKQSEDVLLCQRFVLSIKEKLTTFEHYTLEALKNVFVPTLDFFNHYQTIENPGNQLKQIANSINSIAIIASELWKSIRIPRITEERKKEIGESQKKWGEFGWTLPPNFPIDLFSESPNCKDYANKIAMQYCTDKEMNALFNNLRGMKRVKKTRLRRSNF